VVIRGLKVLPVSGDTGRQVLANRFFHQGLFVLSGPEARERENKKPAVNQRVLEREIGAGDEIRTHDIHLGKVALYH